MIPGITSRSATERAGAEARCTVLIALLLAIAGCGQDTGPAPAGQEDPPAAPRADTATGAERVTPQDTASYTASGDEWTAGITAVAATGPTGTSLVADLRTGSHEGYDRVTIAFDAGASLPGYHIEYVDRPLRECGSGREIHPVGDAWLEIRLDGAAAHTEAGAPTLPAREMDAAGSLLRRIYRTCDFEGVVTFVAAVSAPQRYRVIAMSQPPRLVVDFRH